VWLMGGCWGFVFWGGVGFVFVGVIVGCGGVWSMGCWG
jgi:hypothetical protein